MAIHRREEKREKEKKKELKKELNKEVKKKVRRKRMSSSDNISVGEKKQNFA